VSEARWRQSHRAEVAAVRLADRHYNRQKLGTPQFVPPGRNIVLLTEAADALWVTSWPFAEYVKHAWPGAWVNSLFRNEAPDRYLSSALITEAVAITRHLFGAAPALGIVSFVDAGKTRKKRDPGRCYRKAGWHHVGFTKGGLWAFQQLPDEDARSDGAAHGPGSDDAVNVAGIAKARALGPGPASPSKGLDRAHRGGYGVVCEDDMDILPHVGDIHAAPQLGHLTLPRSGAGQGPGRAFGRRRTRVRAEGNVARSHAAAGSTVKSTDEGPGRVVG
jgi:hypothetical protein